MRRTKTDQWSDELSAVRDSAALFGVSAQTAVLRLLTMGGKVPYRSAIAGMTVRERALIRHLLGREDIRLSPAGPACDFLLAHSPQGKLTIHEPVRGDLRDDDAVVVAGLSLPLWLCEMIDEECERSLAEEEFERHQLDELLHRWHAEEELGARLEEVIDWVERVETVFIYVNRQIFSRSDSGSSTLIRDGLLPALRGRAPEKWTPEERLFVAAIQMLFRTGRAVRFEEFNGRQLSAVSLRRVLLSRCASYLRAQGEPTSSELSTYSLAQLAQLAGDLVHRVDGGGHVRYRRINGLTYAKDEFLLPWARTDRTQDGLHESDVRGAVQKALQAGQDGEEELARILENIVLGAVEASRADYGMSSGIRDLSRLAGLAGEFGDDIMALKKPDFFCCVLASAGMAERLPEGEVSDILWQVAQRMMYNRWHFVPGNFDRSEVPRQRHYFFPPLVPDVAEWADLRHGGHSTARVRYTVRAPGAAMWLEPFRVGGREYRGSYDIRLVRMDGPPFGLDEVRIAGRYSALVDVLWREIAAYAEANGGWAPVFTGFTAQWYADASWRRPLDRLTAQTVGSAA